MDQNIFIGRYLNLDRSQERRERFEAQIDALDLRSHFARFPAVDGATQAEVAPLLPGELGCRLSHIRALQGTFGEHRWLAIVEDDAVLSRFYRSAVEAIARDPQYLAFDVIFTNVRLVGTPYVPADWRLTFDASVTMNEDGSVHSLNAITVASLAGRPFHFTTGYLVNPRSLERVAELVAKSSPEAIDLTYSRLAQDGRLAIGCCLPFITTPDWGAKSEIRPDLNFSVAQRVVDRSLFVDRDIPMLRRSLEALAKRPATPTSDLLRDAYDVLWRAI